MPALANRSPIDRNRLTGEHELADIHDDPLHPGEHHMVSAAGVKDQELAVSAEGPGINDPTVTGRRDLGGGLVAMEWPFSVPPRRSGTPKS